MKQTSECTTILVSKKMTADNSMIVAHSEDWDAMIAKNLTIYRNTNNGPDKFEAIDSPFRCKLPKKAFGYTALETFDLPIHWGDAGFNTAKVGMSTTESIFRNDKALKAKDLIQEFSDRTTQSAMDLAGTLTNELLTQMTIDIQQEYKFSGT